jgi:hypothetical protein
MPALRDCATSGHTIQASAMATIAIAITMNKVT